MGTHKHKHVAGRLYAVICAVSCHSILYVESFYM